MTKSDASEPNFDRDLSPGVHVGTEGVRQEFFLLLINEPRELQSEWGSAYLYRFEDREGNALVTFSSRVIYISADNAWSKGGWARVRATVKRHNVFRGHNQTQLIRVAVLEQLVSSIDVGKEFDELCAQEGIQLEREGDNQ